MTAVQDKDLQEALESAILSHSKLGRSELDGTDALLKLVQTTGQASAICINFQRATVAQARRSSLSWSEIGDALGISKQAAQQRFGLPEAQSPENLRTVHGANAFNEMAMLASEGEAGYHLVGFGPLTLLLKPSKKKWLHKRIIAVNAMKIREQMEADGWEYVGSWFPFHYFKRPVT